MPMQVDFIAHHSIHAGCLEALVRELSTDFECRVRMGPNIKPTNSQIAVVTDHLVFQPNVTKKNYQYLIHVSHDLTDFKVYKHEQHRLSEFDLVLCPGPIHLEQVKKFLPEVKSHAVGWFKYRSIPEHRYKFSDGWPKSVLLALTEIGFAEWKTVIDQLRRLGVKTLIKNHVYYDHSLGLPPPPGQDVLYRKHLANIAAMERYVASLATDLVQIIDPASNICSVFELVDVLITDWSSAAAEFLPYGESIEIGKVPRFRTIQIGAPRPSASRQIAEIKFCRAGNLSETLLKYLYTPTISVPRPEILQFSDLCLFGTERPETTAGQLIRRLVNKLD